jgi:hypothetical protein
VVRNSFLFRAGGLQKAIGNKIISIFELIYPEGRGEQGWLITQLHGVVDGLLIILHFPN